MIAARLALSVTLSAALLAAPTTAPGQVFLATKPHPPFAIGPLFILATVTPGSSAPWLSVSRSASRFPQTPGSRTCARISSSSGRPRWRRARCRGTRTRNCCRYVDERGFEAVSEGRLTLRARGRDKLGTTSDGDPIPEFASFVTFYRRGANPAQTGLGSFIKIPWTPILTDPVTLTTMTMRVKDLVVPKPATWLSTR